MSICIINHFKIVYVYQKQRAAAIPFHGQAQFFIKITAGIQFGQIIGVDHPFQFFSQQSVAQSQGGVVGNRLKQLERIKGKGINVFFETDDKPHRFFSSRKGTIMTER